MKLYTLRLRPGQDLRLELINFAKENDIKAGSIVTCVGGLSQFILRTAGSTPEKQHLRTYSQAHEIVSLSGTVTGDDCHLHIALSNRNGKVVGGHLKEDSRVDLTAEVVIIEDENTTYKREFDGETGFDELSIS